MTVQFRKAISSEAKPLVGLYAESGCGKTLSALLLAKGFAGDMSQVGMIETESGRGEAYADDPVVGGYSVLPIRERFSPKVYGEAIAAAEAAKLRAVIIDSASHEWEGVGGVLAMAAENQAAGRKGPLVWQQPKIDHQREFMLRLQQTPIPLVIVCMRAKYPMYEVKPADVERWETAGRPGGKPPKVGEWARSWQLDPKQSEDILYEMFVHGWIDRDYHRFHGTKYTIDALRRIFVDGEPISVETGQRLAEWASGRGVDAAATYTRMQQAAKRGTGAFKQAWETASAAERTALGKDRRDELKRLAAQHDQPPEDDLGFGENDRPAATGDDLAAQIRALINAASGPDEIDAAMVRIAEIPDEAQRASLDVDGRAKRRQISSALDAAAV